MTIPKKVAMFAVKHQISIRLMDGIYTIWKVGHFTERSPLITQTSGGALNRMRMIARN